MTSAPMMVLSRTLSSATLAQAAVLETVAHGTVLSRVSFVPREVIKDMMDGSVPLLTGENLGTITAADAPGIEIDDLVHVYGKLWNVRSHLADGAGNIKLQLVDAQLTRVDVGGETVQVAIVGDPNEEGPLVAIAAAGILRRSDAVEVHGAAYTVGTPTDWPVAGLRRYRLTPAE